MTHTPTPWKIFNDGMVYDKNNDLVCYDFNRETIVHAVNCHDELVEALRAIVNQREDCGKGDCVEVGNISIERAIKALAKAS
jgi:hypothetical protein